MFHANIIPQSVIDALSCGKTGRDPARLLLVATLIALLLALVPTPALAQAIQVPFIQDFGCSVVQWLRGPLAVLIFIVVCVVVLVFGMIARMDWAHIITVCIIFGVVLGLGSILASSDYINNIPGMAACLQ